MTQLSNPAQQLAAMYGVQDVRYLASAPHRAWAVPLDFAALASGDTVTIQYRNDAGRVFIPESIVGIAYYTSDAAPIIAGTPLHNHSDPSPPAAIGNTLSPLSLITVSMGTDAGPWFGGPLSWPNLVGTAREPYSPRFNWNVPAGVNVICTITNGTDVTISGQICLHGRQIAINP